MLANKTKDELRKEIGQKRRHIDKLQKTEFDKKIYKNIVNLPEWQKSKNIFLYISTKDEVSTRDLIKNHFGTKKIIVPKSHTKSNTLTLHEIGSIKDTAKGSYSILEPNAHTKIVSPQNIAISIIPGIAFDKKGHRVGYGKAYYDKIANSLTGLKIGLAYEVQIVNNIPAQKHDIPVDIIITEKAVYRINK